MDEFKKYLQANRDSLDTDEPAPALWNGVKQTLHPPKRIPLFWKQLAAACIVAAIGAGVYFYTRAGAGREADPRLSARNEQPEVNMPDSAQLSSQPPPMEEVAAPPAHRKNKPEIKTSLKRTEQTPHLSASRQKNANSSKAMHKLSQKADTLYGFENIEASYASMLDIQLEKLRTQPIYAENPEYFSFFKKEFRDLEKDEEKLKQLLIRSEDKTERLDELMLIYQQKISILKQLQFEINKVNNKVKQTNAGIQTQKPSYINL
ncbi:hypothetical protein LZZ85_11970 [Terrimonas sp. NA20]|uniref:Anti-sigma factor n=1 Tax=Terrimonas ginsenosidimutans TaxID=2908004 RepID=A0ABS9KRP1_9BACT|nr:hypothetical protein [Terrimonas ginsenosidimutans]MCG2615005.1 hypothetical protein [Terrimonas ginsenosidimutans]